MKRRTVPAFLLLFLLLLLLIIWAVQEGSLKLSYMQLLKGLFVTYDESVAAVYHLRFPRIVIAVLSGASLAAAGVLFQAVLKNPLADPGIMGITGGANLAAMLLTICMPGLYAFVPAAAIIGAMLTFFLVYSLAWKDGLSPVRIILIGVAVSAVMTGTTQCLEIAGGSQLSGAASIAEGNIALKTWKDVKTLGLYAGIGLFTSCFFISSCNLMALEDKTVRGLGIHIDRRRILCSFSGVVLAGACSGIVGNISFLGLVAPHIGRLIVGHDHKALLPFSMLLGAAMLLFADTFGRWVAAPYEISASILMAVLGGPFFILLLKKKGGNYGS